MGVGAFCQFCGFNSLAEKTDNGTGPAYGMAGIQGQVVATDVPQAKAVNKPVQVQQVTQGMPAQIAQLPC